MPFDMKAWERAMTRTRRAEQLLRMLPETKTEQGRVALVCDFFAEEHETAVKGAHSGALERVMLAVVALAVVVTVAVLK